MLEIGQTDMILLWELHKGTFIMQGYGACVEKNPLLPSDGEVCKVQISQVRENRPQASKFEALAKSISETARKRFIFWKERMKLLLKSPWFYLALLAVGTFAFAGWYFGNIVFLETVSLRLYVIPLHDMNDTLKCRPQPSPGSWRNLRWVFAGIMPFFAWALLFFFRTVHFAWQSDTFLALVKECWSKWAQSSCRLRHASLWEDMRSRIRW